MSDTNTTKTTAPKAKAPRDWECAECGKRFTVKQAKRALYGSGCTCSGYDIDLATDAPKGSAVETFKRPRTLADIRADPRVEEVHHEGSDGWWVSLKRGFHHEDCISIHGATVKQLLEQFAGIERCTAEGCESHYVASVSR